MYLFYTAPDLATDMSIQRLTDRCFEELDMNVLSQEAAPFFSLTPNLWQCQLVWWT